MSIIKSLASREPRTGSNVIRVILKTSEWQRRGLGWAGGHDQPGFDQVDVGIITGLGEGCAVRGNRDIVTVQEMGELKATREK